MPSPPPDPVRATLYAHLAADDALGELLSDPEAIFEEKAPAGTDPPYVVFNHHAGTEQWTFAAPDTERALWLVKGVCRGAKSDPAEAIDTRCRELLHRARIDLPNGRRLTVLRESLVSYGESGNGEDWRHRGGIYRVFT